MSVSNHYDEALGTIYNWKGSVGKGYVANYIWDTGSLTWVPQTAGGGGGGGPATIADGADVAEGTTTDTAWVSGAGTVISLLKKIASAGGSAVSIADAADVVEGALADAAITTDVAGTMNAKMRGLVKMFAAGTAKVDGSGVVQPVSGTFWQVTQPVSGTVTANQGGTPWGQNITQVNSIAVNIGIGAASTGTLRVAVSNDSNVLVTPPTLTKLTQGTTGFSVQNLKDAGRVNLQFYATGVASGATATETAISLTKSADTGATAAAVSFVITNGKRFHITSIMFAARGNATATAQVTTFSIRINTAGAVVTTSTPVVLAARVATPATASAWDRLTVPIGDGIEYTGNGTIQFGVTAQSVFVTNAPTWDVLITGFEY